MKHNNKYIPILDLIFNDPFRFKGNQTECMVQYLGFRV